MDMLDFPGWTMHPVIWFCVVFIGILASAFAVGFFTYWVL